VSLLNTKGLDLSQSDYPDAVSMETYTVPTTVNTYVQSMPLQFVLVHQNCAKSGEGNKLNT